MGRFSRKPKPQPVEERSLGDDYAGALLSAQTAGAGGFGYGDNFGARSYPGAAAAARTSAAETCARWWAAALGSATVAGDPYGAVTSGALALAGRELIRSGEIVFQIRVRAGRVLLIPAVTAWIDGEADPDTWTYRLTLAGPSSTRSVTLPAAAVVHLRWAELPRAPWRGVGPLALAREGARRAWAAETRLADVASIAVGQGQMLTTELSSDEENLTEFVEDLHDWRRANMGGPFVTSRKFDTVDITRGTAPDAADVANAREALSAIAAACGIPPTLLAPEPTAAAGQREAFRQFLFGSVSPLADLLAAELRDKLDAPDIALSFEELRAADITGRARAYRSLVDAGFPPKLAADVCGLPEPPDQPAAADEPADDPAAAPAA